MRPENGGGGKESIQRLKFPEAHGFYVKDYLSSSFAGVKRAKWNEGKRT